MSVDPQRFERAVSFIEKMTEHWWVYLPRERKIIRSYTRTNLVGWLKEKRIGYHPLGGYSADCHDEEITHVVARKNGYAVFAFQRCTLLNCNCKDANTEEWMIFSEEKELKLKEENV